MKIAFTSTDGTTVDSHFGNAESFYLWDIGKQEARPLGRVTVASSEGQEDRILARANALAGCALVCTVQIGGPAAAKLAARHIHPLKTPEATPIAQVIDRLQAVLRGTPPPWLRRSLQADAAAVAAP